MRGTQDMLRFSCNLHGTMPNIGVKAQEGLIGLVLSPVRSTRASLVLATTTQVLRPTSLVLDPTTTGFPMLNHLIDEVKLALSTNVLIELASTEGTIDDDACAATPSSYSS
ncbi:hypothetical protein Ancab_001577 [Ancistrocladus abbreviatus]